MAEQQNPPVEPVKELTDAEKQAIHPSMKWYDKFRATTKRREYRTIAGNTLVQVLGFELGKKLTPIFIEPSAVELLNSFAIGADGEVDYYVLQEDKYKTGDLVAYKDPNYRAAFDLDAPHNNKK